MEDIPQEYQPLLRKVRGWVKANAPYEHNWSDIQLVCYALAKVVADIEKGIDKGSMAPTAGSLQNKEWIAYCNESKRKST